MVARVFGSRIEFGTLDVATEDAYMLAPPCQRIEAWIHASQHVNMRDRITKNCAYACAGVRARFQPAMRRWLRIPNLHLYTHVSMYACNKKCAHTCPPARTQRNGYAVATCVALANNALGHVCDEIIVFSRHTKPIVEACQRNESKSIWQQSYQKYWEHVLRVCSWSRFAEEVISTFARFICCCALTILVQLIYVVECS